MGRTLVAYFSATGTTRRVAGQIAQATGGDLLELRPATPYAAADLDWTDKSSRSSVEMADAACRPALAEAPGDFSAYDTVFIGFPIWWYTAPRIVSTFVESCDLAGKTVVTFATSGGSPMGKATGNLAALTGPEVRWIDGRVLSAGDGAGTRRWVEELGL